MRKRITAFSLCVLLLILAVMTGCSRKNAYEEHYKKDTVFQETSNRGMAEDLAVISLEDSRAYNVDSVNSAELLINDTTNEVIASKDCFVKVYPASITKIMTALLVLERGDLSDVITLNHNVVMNEAGAVKSDLAAGDTVSIESVFKTMLVMSANDCAVILAEYIAGSEQAFAELMTQRAKELGATSTQFKNSNGLHVQGHYTTAYDLYLIFKEAVKHEEFVNTVSMSEYTMEYQNASGKQSEYVSTTNHYLSRLNPVPDGVIMYGGKTGTTSMAGSCLILMTENTQGERFFSVVLGALSKDRLYNSMSGLLEKTAK